MTPEGVAGASALEVTTAAGAATGTFTYVVPAARTLAGARRAVLSYDGRYTAFESVVALVPDDTNGVADVYVYDRVSDTVQRVSVSSLGAQAIGGESGYAAISSSGRFVAFESRATNLVPGDTNELVDIFLRDRDADGDGELDEAGAVTTTRVSVSSDGTQARGGSSRVPGLSGNGRWVVFESLATNLESGDTNGLLDVFVHDRLLGLTRRVNVSSAGLQAIGGPSGNTVISLDGRWVAFESTATTLVTGDTNDRRDVFLHDRDTDVDGVMDESAAQATTRVSVATGGAQGLGGDSGQPSITQEGRWIAFASAATNLVPNDTNGERDVFLHDRVAGTTRRLSVGPGGAQFRGPSHTPAISANGSRLVFLTSGLNATSEPATTLDDGAVFAADDDGKTTTGTVPLPTDPDPPPVDVPPADPNSNVEEPGVSGDGLSTGTTTVPRPGSGVYTPTVDVEGPEPPTIANQAPVIAGLSPSHGPASGAIVVDVEGAFFRAGDVVEWGGTAIATNTINSAVLRVTAPARGALPASVAVRVRRGAEASNAVSFGYQATALSAPDVTSLTVTSGPTTGGSAVTIHGTGFASPTVRFGPHVATVQTTSGTRLEVETPATDVVGPVPVVVTNSDGAVAVSDGPFVYGLVAPSTGPTVTALMPGGGPASGGTAVTILGAHFGPGTTVTVGAQPASLLQILSDSALSVVTPPGTPGIAAPLTVTVPGFALGHDAIHLRADPSDRGADLHRRRYGW